jgi:hypothetical protein
MVIDSEPLGSSCEEGASMPKPVPIPVRKKLLQRAQQGEATASLATAFGLAPRTETIPRPRARGTATRLSPAHAVASDLPGRGPRGGPGPTPETPSLGGGLDPHRVTRATTGDRLAQPADPPTLVPARGPGAGPDGHAAPHAVGPRHRGPPDLADGCRGADPLGQR